MTDLDTSVAAALERLKKREEKQQEPGYKVLCFILLLPAIWWKCWSIALIWGWYCASFSLPAITWHQVVGPALIYSIWTGSSDTNRTAQETATRLFTHAIGYGIGIGIAYIFRP